MSRPRRRRRRAPVRRISYDQLVKQLLVDFPRESLEFFCGSAARHLTPDARITLLRQEQVSRRLGKGHKIVDALPIVEWPDGSREARVFLIEQKLHPTRASVYQVAHYLLLVAQWLERDRGLTDIVPVIIFMKDGKVGTRITLGPDEDPYLKFRCVTKRIATMSAARAVRSGNPAAVANAMSMRVPQRRKVELCLAAVRFWVSTVKDTDLAAKYSEHVLRCAGMSPEQSDRLDREMDKEKDPAMYTFIDRLRDEGKKEGKKEGEKRGEKRGEKKGEKKGEIKGRAKTVLEVLKARKIRVSAADRQRVLACSDLDQLRQWTVRAVTVKSAAGLFTTH